MGWSIVHFKGSQVEFSKLGCKQTEQTLMHFIWVFTVCQSTHLGVYSITKCYIYFDVTE